MADILFLRGAPAFSAFRLQRLQARLTQAVPSLAALQAEYWHFVQLDQPLTEGTRAQLGRLLEERATEAKGRGDLFLVTPRVGTISPWSSKATDIAVNAGLSGVGRIERGIAYYFQAKAKYVFTEGERRQLAALIHELLVKALFNEELGALIQIRREQRDEVCQALRDAGLGACYALVGYPNDRDHIRVIRNAKAVISESRVDLQRAWSETSFRLQSLRDNPACAQEEYDRLLDTQDTGLSAQLGFDPAEDVAAPFIATGARPRVAILREQGVNSHTEMAAAFDRAGFAAVDVHMSDILGGRVDLADFKGAVACGGFSYGDVLGAGQGWAKTILFNARARDQFAAFFGRQDTFALGVCNGCQMMSALKEVIPGADHWPALKRNTVEQFEARFVMGAGDRKQGLRL